MNRKVNVLSSLVLALTLSTSAWAYTTEYKQAGHFKNTGERLCAETLNSKFDSLLSEFPQLKSLAGNVKIRRVDGTMRFLSHTVGKVARGLSRGMADDKQAQMLSTQNRGEANWNNGDIDFELTYIYSAPSGDTPAACDFNISLAQVRTFLNETSKQPRVTKNAVKNAIKLADKVRDVLKEFNKNGLGTEVAKADFESLPGMLDIKNRKGSYVVDQARSVWTNALNIDGAAAAGEAK